jgi:hypothetical protein
MAEHGDQQCFNCKRMLPYDLMIPGEVLRPAILETVKKRNPAWSANQMICVDCLDGFRSEYVEDALKEEVGDLTQLEQEVVESIKEQETLTESL